MGAARLPVAPVSGLDVDIADKRFGSQPVLGAVRFRLAAGERAALLGPSGIGKSTLLGLIAGYDAGFEGRIGRPPGPTAMVFQTPRLLSWRTLAENIALMPDSGGPGRARALLAEVGLGEVADAFPERISLGMQRRVALARALAVEPALILLDEPLVSLDPDTAAGMRRLLVRLLDRTAAASLMATHDRREALAIADRVLELDGRPARIVSDRLSPLAREARRDPAAVEALHREWYGFAIEPRGRSG